MCLVEASCQWEPTDTESRTVCPKNGWQAADDKELKTILPWPRCCILNFSKDVTKPHLSIFADRITKKVWIQVLEQVRTDQRNKWWDVGDNPHYCWFPGVHLKDSSPPVQTCGDIFHLGRRNCVFSGFWLRSSVHFRLTVKLWPTFILTPLK